MPKYDHIIFDWQGVLEQANGLNDELINWMRKRNDDFSFSILTNFPADFSVRLKKMGIDDLFEVVSSPKNSPVRKPDPRAYQLILTKIEKSADRCLFIDDSSTNVIAAKDFGIDSIHYKNNSQLFKEFNKIKL